MSKSLNDTCLHYEESSYHSTTWSGRSCTMMIRIIYCIEVNFATRLLSLWCLPRDLNSLIIEISEYHSTSKLLFSKRGPLLPAFFTVEQ